MWCSHDCLSYQEYQTSLPLLMLSVGEGDVAHVLVKGQNLGLATFYHSDATGSRLRARQLMVQNRVCSLIA